MKNVSLNVTPNYLAPAPMPTSPPPQFPVAAPVNRAASFSLSAQFDNEDEALDFTSFIISKINEYKNRHQEKLNYDDIIKMRND